MKIILILSLLLLLIFLYNDRIYVILYNIFGVIYNIKHRGSKATQDDTGRLNIRLIQTLQINTNPDDFGTADHFKYHIERRERYFNWSRLWYGYRWLPDVSSNGKDLVGLYESLISKKQPNIVIDYTENNTK